jgi:hypothetical protein
MFVLCFKVKDLIYCFMLRLRDKICVFISKLKIMDNIYCYVLDLKLIVVTKR